MASKKDTILKPSITKPLRAAATVPASKQPGKPNQAEEQSGLMAGLMYGGGLRLMECVRLRVKDVDFERNQILVRDGKGQKDRITMLPERFAVPLKEHLARVMAIYHQDRTEGRADVYLRPAFARKYPNAGKEWIWQ